jgi:orotidine-5'-phosphate decarboxylase
LPGAGGAAPAPDPVRHFGDRLAEAVAQRESQVVLGIDPDPARLWPAAEEAGEAHAGAAAGRAAADDSGAGGARERLAAVVAAHCRALIDAAAPACVAAKPQLACFERLGAPGWRVLEQVCAHARERGLLVLADGKRGDVPVTAAAYGEALLGPGGGLEVDAFTANPLLGADALEPLIAAARRAGAGPFVLVRTSNPGAADVLDSELAAGGRLWERLAALVAELGRTSTRGLADVGAVTGATAPEHLERLRELMPATPFLLPGVGAQGGDVRALAPAFAPGPAGGLVTASRSIAHAHEATGGAPVQAARAEAERLREQAWRLA